MSERLEGEETEAAIYQAQRKAEFQQKSEKETTQAIRTPVIIVGNVPRHG